MSSHAKLLRNITVSGGLFTENILLKLRDRPESQKIGQLELFLTQNEIKKAKELGTIKLEKITSLSKQEKRELVKKQRRELFEWGERKWEDVFPKIDTQNISKDDIQQQWLIPLFEGFGYSLEKYIVEKSDLVEESYLNDFEINFQSQNSDNQLFFSVRSFWTVYQEICEMSIIFCVLCIADIIIYLKYCSIY